VVHKTISFDLLASKE